MPERIVKDTHSLICPGPLEDLPRDVNAPKQPATLELLSTGKITVKDCPAFKASDNTCSLSPNGSKCIFEALTETLPDGTEAKQRISESDSFKGNVTWQIITGELPVIRRPRPGTISTSVRDLAEEHGIGRSPAREGLLVLEHIGLIDMVNNRGIRVVNRPEDIHIKRLQARP